MTTPAPAEVDLPETEEQTDEQTGEQTGEQTAKDIPWVTIVWNDPVNLMSYVAYVFRNYFGYTDEKSKRLMLQVHSEGKAIVSSGSREEMERHVQAMHEYGLWATLQKADV